MKTLGLDLSKYLKFKPWGATELANRAAGFLAVLGLGLELWDSYEKAEQEKKFRNAIADMIKNFEDQKKEISEMINGGEFITNFFPSYVDLQNKLQSIQIDISEMDKQQLLFKNWVEMGEIIDVEFSEIKKLS